MADVKSLIEKQKQMDAAEDAPANPVVDHIRALIEKAQKAYDNAPWEPVDVVLGGELVTIEARVIRGGEWCDLEAKHPPEPADRGYGYNRTTLPRDYPVERLRVAGDPIDGETWRAMWDALEAPHKENVAALLWGLNIYAPTQRAKELKTA